MRMQKTGLFFVALFALLGWEYKEYLYNYMLVVYQKIPVKRDSLKENWKFKKIEDARISKSYVIEENKWLLFDFLQGSSFIKIITNANIKNTTDFKAKESFNYVISYQILDKNKKILYKNNYHYRGKLVQYFSNNKKTKITTKFLLESSTIPLSSQIFLLPINEKLQDASVLKMKINSKDKKIVNIVARVFFRQKTAKHKLDYLWFRIPYRTKKFITKSNIYNTDLLSEKEKRNLLRYNWVPRASRGIEGIDYKVKKLFFLQDLKAQKAGIEVLPKGVLTNNILRGIIPLPECGGKIKLMFRYLEKTTGINNKNILVKWYGKNITKRLSYNIALSNKKFVHNFEGGLLEILSPVKMLIRAYIINVGKIKEITPNPIFLRTWLCNKISNLKFRIYHINNNSVPFRVDIRTFKNKIEDIAKDFFVDYKLLDKNKAIISKGKLILDKAVSLYDSPWDLSENKFLSEVTKYYFSLPSNVSYIEFSSKSIPVLINAYNRPQSLVKEIEIPQDYYSFNYDKKERTWFLLKPVKYKRLIHQDLSPLIVVQSRPPEDKKEILEGKYTWENFLPQGNWQGRYLLTPIEEKIKNPKALANLYYKLPVNKNIRLNFRAPYLEEKIIPKLIYLNNQVNKPFDLKILIDNSLYYESTFYNKKGKILLPFLKTGYHTIKIIGQSSLQCYISNIQTGNMLKRFAIKIPQTTLSFKYTKMRKEEEMISAKIFFPSNEHTSTRFLVKIEKAQKRGYGPYNNWSILRRIYNVKPAKGTPIIVMNTKDEFVDQGQNLFIPIGNDLKPGDYIIHIKQKGSAKYIILSRTLSGLSQIQNISYEEE